MQGLMKTGFFSLFFVVFAGLFQSAWAAGDVAQPSQILPHRGLYKMSLDSARNGSHISGAEGKMFFAWQDACNGWNTEQRLDLSLSHDDGTTIALKSAYVTWEEKSGQHFRFNYRQTVNNRLQEEYRGSASLPAAGKPGVATYILPEAKDIPLPEGTLFPTAHTLALINAASHKQAMFNAPLFDGTDEAGYSDVSAVISAQRAITNDVAKTGLGDLPPMVWPVRMAFFDANTQNSEPDYEMDTTMLPNGVSEYMLLDYGEFRLRGTLVKVELLPKPDC